MGRGEFMYTDTDQPTHPPPSVGSGLQPGRGPGAVQKGSWLYKHSHTVILGNAFWKYTTHPIQSKMPPSTQLCLKSQRTKYLQQEEHFVRENRFVMDFAPDQRGVYVEGRTLRTEAGEAML